MHTTQKIKEQEEKEKEEKRIKLYLKKKNWKKSS